MKAKLYVLRSSFLVLVCSLFINAICFSQQVAKSIPNSSSPDGIIGFLEFRPSDYGTQKHPLIIFLHGIGERGNGSPSQIGAVAANAIPSFCARGATMRFTVAGQTSSFVVLSPQLSVQFGYWPTFYVTEMIKYAKANLQIDTNRIYLAGLSLGGGGVWRAITDVPNFTDYSFDAGIAAAAPVCGTQEENDGYFCNTVGANHLPVWAFHCMDDGTVAVNATQHTEIIAGRCNITPAPIFTYYQSGGHSGAWINAFDTGHITRTLNTGASFTANPNLYEWFLAHTRASGGPVNTPPVANAGSAQIITLPVSTVTLNGSGTGTNGASIVSYSWTKTSGPAGGAISVPLSNTTLVTGLLQGVYVYTLTVTDNNGLQNSSTVSVTVNPLINLPPTANAGSNIAITLPTNNTTLNGSASSDADGTISTYAWTKTSGPSTYTIASPGSASTALTNLVQGTYVFTLKVTDNGGASSTSNVTVTVNPAANQPPVANAGSNIAITLPTNNTTLNGTASSDPDGTISTYAWTKTSGPSTYTIANSGAASTALSNLVQGVYTFTLQVTDNSGASATSNVTVTVNPAANQSPVANAGSNINITLPTNNTTLNGSGSNDPDGTISTYAWTKTSGPSSYSIANAGAASTALSNLVQGVYTFTLQVTDNAGASATSSVTVTVNAAPNQSPVANAGSNISITLPVNNTTLNGTASNDPDGTISTYAWTKTSGPSSYSIANAGAASTALSNLVQGTYVFTLQVTDNSGATASSSVTVIVNAAPPPANQSPVANAGSNIVLTLPTNSTSLNGTASNDPDGTIATYAWTKTSGPSSYSIANASAATTALTNLVQGNYVFTLQVTDNGGATASSAVSVTVNAAPPPPNQSPVANAGSNISITLPVNNTTLNGSASNDPDGTISTYAWTKTSGPSSYSIANAGAATTALTNLVAGTYVFSLQVTDNAGASSAATVTVTVNAAAPPPNQAPVANAGADISISLPTNTATLNGSASSDADGSIASYQWTKTSGPSSYSIADATAATTSVSNLTQGVYTFTLQVTDNSGATATATVNITVTAAPPATPPANQPPVANAGANIVITLPTNSTTLDGSASSDADGSISSYNWAWVSGPSSYNLSNPAAVAPTLSNLTEGVYVFNLTVTDNRGATAASTVTVTVVAAANQPPVANAGASIVVTLPTNSASLDGSASADADGRIIGYSWSKSSGPASYNITDPSAASTQVTNLTEGVYVFTLQVTDNAGATTSSNVTITVNPRPNQAPVAHAGIEIDISLPDNSTNLDGTGSYDPDGSIVNYSWNKIAGPGAVTIVNSNTAIPTVVDLAEGVYTFELTVTDNDGATATDRVEVHVGANKNQLPVAIAGTDTTIALPLDSLVLSGLSSTDADGNIAAYHWSKVSGPGTGIIQQPNAGITVISGLAEGDYVFELQVTDNSGGIATARVKVTVVNNFRYSQYFKVYPNPATTTLNMQFIDDKIGKLGIVMYDVEGKLVMSQEFSKDQSLITKQLDVSRLKPGMYYLEIRHADGSKLIRPFVKQ